jgi:acetyl esterase/lipase
MNAAVDAIRARLGLDRIALAGQSGGATIAAALLTLGRSDVLCAAPASGGYDLAAMLDWHARRLGVEETHREKPAVMAGRFNVMDRIVDIRPDAGRRIFVVGDAEDQVTPFAQQRRFAELLKAAGHHAELVEARGQGAERHGLSVTALRLAGMCAAGASDQDIRRAARP